MSVFVSKPKTWSISVGDSPSRADTPILEIRNLVPGNLVRVVAEFFATTGSAETTSGFEFKLAAVNANEVTVLSPVEGRLQAAAGWQSVSRTAFFKIDSVNESPTEDVDFEVLFTKGDFEGTGQLGNFLLRAEVVSTNA